MKKLLPPSRLSGVALAALAFCGTASAQQTDAQMANELRQLRQEMLQMRKELEQLKGQQAAAPAAPAAGPAQAGGAWSPAAPSTYSSAATVQGAPVAASSGSGLRFFGYGELSYTRPRKDPSGAMATAGRGVFGFGYHFNERTRMAAEIEIENAVVSASDKGEVAFEQLYIEHDIKPTLSAKAGLFLIPVGILNETHEPTRYFGVRRNLVETAIIPTTWRELGVNLRGTLDNGLRWDAGLVTGFDLTKWDASSREGRESPLGSIHQEGQFAKARSLAGYGAVNYNGIPGFNIGGSAYHGGAGHKQPGFAGADATVTLTEAHARWQPGRWDLSALAAFGRFGNVSALNATFAGLDTPIPNRFGGWYTQAAYKVWQDGEQSLWPFARYERLNTARGFSGLPDGTAPAAQRDTRAVTVGASYFLHPQVVVKADYMRFANDSRLDRFNLGVGFHY